MTDLSSTPGTPIFHRLELLVGKEALGKLWNARVILFGVGGVGSWTAEALIRSGIGHLTIVDSDLICATNVNRQVQATSSTIGHVKVQALASRLREINPHADIVPIQKVYDKDSCSEFDLKSFDIVIDAIDSLSSKVTLIVEAIKAETTLFSALGASCKLDPTRLKVASIWKTKGCRLGRFVRKRLRKRLKPGDDFLCVYSDELRDPFPGSIACGSGKCVCPTRPKGLSEEEEEEAFTHEWCSAKKQINGSAVHITATVGMFLCGLVMQHLSPPPEADPVQ